MGSLNYCSTCPPSRACSGSFWSRKGTQAGLRRGEPPGQGLHPSGHRGPRGAGDHQREDGFLKIVEGEETARQIEGIIRFYDGRERVARRRLLFRGILNAAQYACLVHFGTFVGLMEARASQART